MDKNFEYLAIYFRMGMFEGGDNVPPELIDFDCLFDDSPVLYAQSEEELEFKIRKIYDEGDWEGEGNLPRDWGGVDWEGIYPDIICDNKGEMQIDLYRRITSEENFHPDTVKYSFGKETLTQLWEREKWKFI